MNASSAAGMRQIRGKPGIRWTEPRLRTAGLIQAPATLRILLRGVETFTTPLARTLGPAKGMVMNERSKSEHEFLLDSATIATRVIELPGRGENIGAMMVRSLVMDIHERYGDGAATAAVIAQAALREAVKRIVAGANPALLKRGMERALAAAQLALQAQTQPVTGQEQLAAIASSVTGDAELGAVLGEVFETLGEHTALVTEETYKPGIDREYIVGGQWDAHPASDSFILEGKAGLELRQPLILVVDEQLISLEQVQPALELAAQHPEKPPLLIVASREIEGEALAMLLVNHRRGVLTIAPAILNAGLDGDDLGDIAALTGAQLFSPSLGWSAREVRISSFGRARKITLTRNSLGIVAGRGSQEGIRERMTGIRAQLARMDRGNKDRQALRMRLARLSGGIGIVKMGTNTEQESELKKEKVEQALLVLEAVQEHGVVPGGGIAYLACIPAVRAIAQEELHEDELSGVMVVARALEAPFFQIVRNAGTVHPPVALMEVHRRGPACGFDVQRGAYVCMREAGILDSVLVIACSLRRAFLRRPSAWQPWP